MIKPFVVFPIESETHEPRTLSRSFVRFRLRVLPKEKGSRNFRRNLQVFGNFHGNTEKFRHKEKGYR